MISGMRVRRRSSAGAGGGYRFYRWYITNGTSSGVSLRGASIRYSGGGTTGMVVVNATASSHFEATPPENAINMNTTAVWKAQGDVPQWLQFEVADPTLVAVEYLLRASNAPTSAPTAWEFQASRNGTTWETLHSVPSMSWAANQTRAFPL